jgi:hypothetical protein
MDKLTETLFQLLYDREFRARFEREVKGVEAGDEFADFQTIDWKQLNLFGDSIERKVFADPLVAGKTLEEVFAGTVEKLRQAEPGFRRLFLVSAPFAAYSDMNHSKRCLSLEEAFYLFSVDIMPGLEPVTRHEFLSAHLQTLAVHGNPAFRINRDFIQNLKNGYCSIQALGGGIRLYACVGQKFISGPIDQPVAEVLRMYFTATAVTAKEDEPLVAGLKELGFVPMR